MSEAIGVCRLCIASCAEPFSTNSGTMQNIAMKKKVPAKKKAGPKKDRIEVDLELDSDVVDWLRSFGEDWEDKFNAVLRAEMMKEIESKKPAKRRQRTTKQASRA